MGDEIERYVIGSAQQSDARAWRQLFGWHFDAVYRFCLALSGGRAAWAEEVAQQVFVTAAGRICRFDPGQGTFRMWLLGIARKHHMALRAREARRKRHEAVAATANPGPSPAPETDLGVFEALARLPHRYRDILEAKYLRQMTTGQIAEARGLTVAAAESLLRRARGRFAEVYGRTKTRT